MSSWPSPDDLLGLRQMEPLMRGYDPQTRVEIVFDARIERGGDSKTSEIEPVRFPEAADQLALKTVEGIQDQDLGLEVPRHERRGGLRPEAHGWLDDMGEKPADEVSPVGSIPEEPSGLAPA
jgi:hypothetical protein